MKTNRLSERAVLVHFQSHEWTGRKMDKRLADETANVQQADKDALEVIVRLVPPKALMPIKSARANMYKQFVSLSLPWMDGAIRILPTNNFLEFREKMRKCREAYDKAVSDFLAEWPTIVADTKRLGKLHDKYKLPTCSDLKQRFDVKIDILPVPDIADWRAKLGDDEAAEIAAEVKNNIESLVTNAMKSIWSQLGEFVGRIADTMSKKEKKFRSSIFDNLIKFCESIPKLNLTNDEELEKIRKEVIKLCNVDIFELREIPNSRKKVAEEAKDVLSKIEQYMKK